MPHVKAIIRVNSLRARATVLKKSCNRANNFFTSCNFREGSQVDVLFFLGWWQVSARFREFLTSLGSLNAI